MPDSLRRSLRQGPRDRGHRAPLPRAEPTEELVVGVARHVRILHI